MSIRCLMDHTVTVQENTPVKSSTGHVKAGWANKTTGVCCTIQARASDSRYESYGIEVDFDYVGYFLPDVDLLPTNAEGPRDRVVDTDGNAFEVVWVRDITGRDLFREALLRRVA